MHVDCQEGIDTARREARHPSAKLLWRPRDFARSVIFARKAATKLLQTPIN
jgi:hypothetical protein